MTNANAPKPYYTVFEIDLDGVGHPQWGSYSQAEARGEAAQYRCDYPRSRFKVVRHLDNEDQRAIGQGLNVANRV
jgi:hypothetical protein